jgi:hypothetical protein
VSYGATAAYGLVMIMAIFTTIFLLVTRPAVRRAPGEE